MNYKIQGDNLPVVICQLEQNEKMVTQSGAMTWMSPNMKMETTSNGGVGKAFGRMFAGESFFQNIYTATGGNGLIAFANSFPGEIRPFQIGSGQEIIMQKRAFLASEEGVKLEVYFQKRFATGVFGGEGFIMQRLYGNGIVFAEFDGSIVEYDLNAGQTIVVSTGNLAAMSTSCKMDVQTVPGLKNKVFGGEGLFNTIVTGPGHVWLQTMPISSLANDLRSYFPSNNG